MRLTPAGFGSKSSRAGLLRTALVPEAVAFAFVAGVEPLVGLYAAFFIVGLILLFGGRPVC
jgi:SulP family sulfate permease